VYQATLVVPQHCQDVCKALTDYRSLLDSRFALPIIIGSKVSPVNVFPVLFKLILSKKLTLKGAFRHFKEIKIISRKSAANAAHQKIDKTESLLLTLL